MKKFIKKLFQYSSFKVSIFFNYCKKKLLAFGRSKKINKYLNNSKVKKLHIGCSHASKEGWLPTDISPQSNSVIYLDATDKFPFEDNIFDYIYCEHMIEHINYFQASYMLEECFRISKPNGKIRIATPDLDKYLSLIYDNKKKENLEMIDFYMNDLFSRYPNDENAAMHILNLEMHSWGHKYLYNLSTLKNQLVNSGFSKISQHDGGKSDDHNFKNLEMHKENQAKKGIHDKPNFFDFETVIVEAEK
tara:strand:+ start:5238 stop:5978 length:741 start_codon:yes stop_codon:yes gene_type:complete